MNQTPQEITSATLGAVALGALITLTGLFWAYRITEKEASGRGK